MTKKTKKSPRPRGRPAKNQDLTEAFQVRCTPEQKAAYEAEAARLGFRRGPHDTGVGMLVRQELDRAVTRGKLESAGIVRYHGDGGAS
jgi:hypothetical protein